MKRLIVILVGVVLASVITCLQQECSERRHGPMAETATISPTVEIRTALKRAVQFFQPDTTSNLRFGRPANTPRP